MRKRARRVGMGTRRGFHPKGWFHLHVLSSDLFSPRQLFFPSPPGKERGSFGTRGLARYIDRQHGEKLYRFKFARIDSAGGDRRECMSARRWGSSSAGRAPRSQRGGREFDPPLLHHLSFLMPTTSAASSEGSRSASSSSAALARASSWTPPASLSPMPTSSSAPRRSRW